MFIWYLPCTLDLRYSFRPRIRCHQWHWSSIRHASGARAEINCMQAGVAGLKGKREEEAGSAFANMLHNAAWGAQWCLRGVEMHPKLAAARHATKARVAGRQLQFSFLLQFFWHSPIRRVRFLWASFFWKGICLSELSRVWGVQIFHVTIRSY